jgi:hypothetical protein
LGRDAYNRQADGNLIVQWRNLSLSRVEHPINIGTHYRTHD